MSAQDVTVDALVARLRNPDTELALLDVREEGQFGEGHMLWAVNLPYSRLEAGVRALVPRRAAPVVLVDDGDGVAPRAARRLATLGYTSLHVLAGGVAAWAAAGHPLFHGVYVPGKVLGEWAEARYATPSIDAQQLLRLQAAGRPVRILDPRTEAEHTARHVPGAWSCPNGELLYRQAWRDLPPDSLIVVACGGRTRGIVGAQTLIDADVGHPVAALQDGNHGWQLAGLTLAQGLARRAEAPVGADRREAGRALARRHGVPQIDAARLRAWQADPTRTLYLLDVRDPAAYARGHLPGAVNAPGGQLVQASDRWLGTLRARVVLVDDDGIRAVQSALWLRRLGWEASALHASADALTQGAASQPAADAADAPAAVGAAAADAAARVELALDEVAPQAEEIGVAAAHAALAAGALAVFVDRSDAYEQAHPPGAVWASRARLDAVAALARGGRAVVLFSLDGRLAHLAAQDLHEAAPQAAIAVVRGGVAAWRAQGLPLTPAAAPLAREARIDFLFWAHDRRRGNAESMRAYLAWERQLLAQASREPGGFPLAGGPAHEELA